MKKVFFTFVLALTFMYSSMADTTMPSNSDSGTTVDVVCHKIEIGGTLGGNHRSPVKVPIIFYSSVTSTLNFESPCYECTLELVVPGTDTIAYSYSILDGETTVSLPAWLEGEYELHIHRGNYCFMGIIEL